MLTRFFYEIVDSTSSEAELLLESGIVPPFSVIAKSQTSGRGQRGNVWQSETPGNVYMSTALKQEKDLINLSNMPADVACKICDKLEKRFGISLRVKFPNDLYFFNKKVGGILLETKIKNENLSKIICGVGINVGFSPNLGANSYQATCLSEICNKPVKIDEIYNIVEDSIVESYSEICYSNNLASSLQKIKKT